MTEGMKKGHVGKTYTLLENVPVAREILRFVRSFRLKVILLYLFGEVLFVEQERSLLFDA